MILVAQNTTAANVMTAVIAVAERVVANTLSGRSCMNELAAANINTNMANLGTSASLREEDQIADLLMAKDAVVSGEVTLAVRDSVVGGISVRAGDAIGILCGDLITAKKTEEEALLELLSRIEDMDDREIITLFVGREVSEDARASVTEMLKKQFPAHTVECYVGGQEIYDYLGAVE